MSSSQRFDPPTIRFYDEHAEEYISSTLSVDMRSVYERFLRLIPSGGRILDAGCGSGRDSRAFLDRGFQVVSLDASQSMVDATSRLTGQQAIQLSFQEVDFSEEFDGIWACASLLHVPLSELSDVIGRLSAALRPAGILYASFKEGRGEHRQDGRLFTDMDESSIQELIDRHRMLEMIQLWHSNDLRPARTDHWLNALLRKALRDEDRGSL